MNPSPTHQKAQLHEVADLMLEIYQTLVDMRYLDPMSIQMGPHNLTALNPQFQELDIDPAVQYLYSILPYIDTSLDGTADFLHGGEFADFLRPRAGESGPRSLLRLGNHGSVIVYDARRHLIWIIDQEGWATTDLALQEVEAKDPQSPNRNSFEHIPHRPAGDALRDIVRWYRGLDEIPPRWEFAWYDWSVEPYGVPVRALYEKNGWPDEFDGDAFEVDYTRAYARLEVDEFSQEPIVDVERRRDAVEYAEGSITHWIESLARAQTKEEQWEARWAIWGSERAHANAEDHLVLAERLAKALCPGEVCMRSQDRPLWELQWLREEVEILESEVRAIGTEWTAVYGEVEDDIPREQWEMERYAAERQLAVYQNAYEAARLDAERLCPGQTFQSVTGREKWEWTVKMDRHHLLDGMMVCRELAAAKAFLDQLPDDVPAVRSSVIEFIEHDVSWLKTSGLDLPEIKRILAGLPA
ncbi:uncharacterized protein BO97DRAFT_383518 [Aspergillus homomorphus CBS 101889]|uniref:Uncharacterized protein n=1 Tax=Aspergillus homomorphus (strain CBS 101889) TaxID=1450537 RepID=A0A395I9P5_ASPHC|nr:hypothetical protein BO97DRAFT_383518 [Aspergillus homomorphus CBS 101889]RAL15788.1 hypothetical protein BO97DRAFT_383518 [Aspergillus homomorphus CBS 101889]